MPVSPEAVALIASGVATMAGTYALHLRFTIRRLRRELLISRGQFNRALGAAHPGLEFDLDPVDPHRTGVGLLDRFAARITGQWPGQPEMVLTPSAKLDAQPTVYGMDLASGPDQGAAHIFADGQFYDIPIETLETLSAKAQAAKVLNAVAGQRPASPPAQIWPGQQENDK